MKNISLHFFGDSHLRTARSADQADHHLHPQRGGEIWAKRVPEALGVE